MGLDSQFSILDGFCIYCGDSTRVMAPNSRPFLSVPAETGVCDLCAYTLGHAWRRELGQLVRATSPRVTRTYFLVPRLSTGKGVTDLASYQFVVAPDDNLPYVDFPSLPKQAAWLKERLGLVTWEPLFRSCYLGYAASGDFSEVVLARAWGKVPGTFIKARFATFGELLEKPTPDAGFYLGVKAAFEGMLWRLEQASEEDALCTVMREPAMRYLKAQLTDQLGDEEDLAMVEMFRTMMTANEIEVVRLVVETGKRPATSPRVKEKKAPEKVDEKADEPVTDVSGLEGGVEEEATADDALGDVPEGFARPVRTTP